MSMMWMPMPGQTWTGAATGFVGMWAVMMAGMMAPSIVPVLWRHYRTITRSGVRHPGWHVAAVSTGYMGVWAAFGLVVFPAGVLMAGATMRQPSVARLIPFVAALVIILAGAWQLSGWKARHLASCHRTPWYDDSGTSSTVKSWRYGLRLGAQCATCCANLMAVQLALGVMDVRAMLFVAACITAERVTTAGERVARVTGPVIVGVGALLILVTARA